MSHQSETSRVRPSLLVGALLVLVALCFQIFGAPAGLVNTGELAEADSISLVIEKDGLSQLANFDKLESDHLLFHPTLSINSLALHLNEGLTNKLGRASVPHSNQSRYILFRNPKLDCAV